MLEVLWPGPALLVRYKEKNSPHVGMKASPSMNLKDPFPLRGIACLAGFLLAANLVASEPAAESLFDGGSLKGWDGDPRFWRVEDGSIVGQTTAENNPPQNTFLIYRGREFADFELTFSYRVEGFNSGMQYRSVDRGNWLVSGYQADFEARCHHVGGTNIDQYSGMFFEENGRMFLAQRGQAVVVRDGPNKTAKPLLQVIGSIGDTAKLEAVIHRDDWNEYRIVANGYQFIHIINGRVMSIGIDEDRQHRRASGIIAIQLHKGPPMEIRVKDIKLRELNKD